MMKQLFFSVLAMLTAVSASAFEVGDYAMNATQRFKVTGENLVTNGNFANGLEGWYGANKETAPSADVWSVEENAGPKSEKVITSIAATADLPLCNSWTLESGSYIVSYQVKTATGTNLVPHTVTTKNDVTTVTVPANCADFFINTTGSLLREAPTEEAPVTGVATTVYADEEWKTMVYFFTIEEGQNLIMHFEKLTEGTSLTNVEIHKAEQVYDVRIAQNQIAFAKELMENPAFNVEEAQDAKANLQGIIETIEGMIASGEMDDPSNAESLMASFDEEGLEPYLAVTSVNVKTLIPGLDIASLAYWGRAGKYSADYKLDLQGNWGHLETEKEVLRSAIQTGYAHTASYAAFNEDFPAGKYFFSCEIRNANTGKSSWPTEPVYNLETECKMFIGNDTITLDTICGEQYQRFNMVAEVGEDGKFRAGVEWPGTTSGGAFFIKNTIVRAFNLDIESSVEHIQAFKNYMVQWNAAIDSRKMAHNLIGNANYPWGQQELKVAVDILDPIFATQASKMWSDSEGKDAGIASTEELNDWALYQGIEAYSEPDSLGNVERLKYQLVRGYQGASNTVKSSNQIFTDLAEAIDAAKKTRNQGAYLTGDREAYKTAILTALSTLKSVRSTTTDATRVADSTTIDNALQTLNSATEAFLASVKNEPIVDIDFAQSAVEITEDGSNFTYAINGTKNRMQFTNFDPVNSGNSNFTQGSGEELMDVLRVGNGKAYVILNEADLPGETDAIRFDFDIWHGSLSGKSAGVELQNAAGERVAGFSIDRYKGIVSYNDFNEVLTDGGTGMNILKYVSGLGSSKVNNAAIKDDAKNTSSYSLVVNYKDRTLQGTIVNSKNGTCEGATMSFRSDIEDQQITQFVLVSNYNNEGRRCWFDNLKIMKYALMDVEEDITESPWAEHQEWVDGIKSVNTVMNSNVVYTLSGLRVAKADKPGLYIINGRKVVVR